MRKLIKSTRSTFGGGDQKIMCGCDNHHASAKSTVPSKYCIARPSQLRWQRPEPISPSSKEVSLSLVGQACKAKGPLGIWQRKLDDPNFSQCSRFETSLYMTTHMYIYIAGAGALVEKPMRPRRSCMVYHPGFALLFNPLSLSPSSSQAASKYIHSKGCVAEWRYC